MEFTGRFTVKYRLVSGSVFGVVVAVIVSLIFLSHKLAGETPEPFPLVHLLGAAVIGAVIGWLGRIPGWRLAGFRVSPLVDLKAAAVEAGGIFVGAATLLFLLGLVSV